MKKLIMFAFTTSYLYSGSYFDIDETLPIKNPFNVYMFWSVILFFLLSLFLFGFKRFFFSNFTLPSKDLNSKDLSNERYSKKYIRNYLFRRRLQKENLFYLMLMCFSAFWFWAILDHLIKY